jgi:hypothetical protein
MAFPNQEFPLVGDTPMGATFGRPGLFLCLPPNWWLPPELSAKWKSLLYPLECSKESILQWRVALREIILYYRKHGLRDQEKEASAGLENDLCLICQYDQELMPRARWRPRSKNRGGKRGRPRDTNAKRDKRIYDAWRSRRHKDLDALANAFEMSKRDVKLASISRRWRTPRHLLRRLDNGPGFRWGAPDLAVWEFPGVSSEEVAIIGSD